MQNSWYLLMKVISTVLRRRGLMHGHSAENELAVMNSLSEAPSI